MARGPLQIYHSQSFWLGCANARMLRARFEHQPFASAMLGVVNPDGAPEAKVSPEAKHSMSSKKEDLTDRKSVV